MGSIVGSITDAVGLTDIEGTRERGEAAARQQREAAQRAAQISAFRPVGMTTRFGTGAFDITDVGGVPRVTGARYTVAPELVALQNQLMGLTPGAITGAQSAQTAAQRLFNLGGQYIGESPAAARQQIFNELQAARLPAQLQEEQRLGAGVFGRGRAGLNVSGIGQPELYTLARAREAQRAADITNAEAQAQQRLQFGTGLFGTGSAMQTQALGPLQSYLGTIGTIEGLGQQPFNLGLQVGGAAQTGANTGAQLLQSGLSSAATTQQRAGDAASQQLTGFMNQMLGSAIGSFGGAGGFGGGGSPFGGGGWANPYAASAGVNFTAPGVYG